MLSVSHATSHALAHCSNVRHVRPPPPRASSNECALYGGAQLYELGKQQMKRGKFGAALELFEQTAVILTSASINPVTFRALESCKVACTVHLRLEAQGQTHELSKHARELRQALQDACPALDRAVAKRYVYELNKYGITCARQMTRMTRTDLRALLTQANVACGHAQDIVRAACGTASIWERLALCLGASMTNPNATSAFVALAKNAVDGDEEDVN